jgi:hypothetical protein
MVPETTLSALKSRGDLAQVIAMVEVARGARGDLGGGENWGRSAGVRGGAHCPAGGGGCGEPPSTPVDPSAASLLLAAPSPGTRSHVSTAMPGAAAPAVVVAE